MKAIILTYAPVKDNEKQLIKSFKGLKVLINHTPNEFNAQYRIFRDYPYYEGYLNYPEKLITWKKKHPKIWFTFESTQKPNSDNPKELFFMGGSITCGVDFAIKQGATAILLIADNTVHSRGFQDEIKIGITKLSKHANIYKYNNIGNFNNNTKYKSIQDFINEL